MKFIYCLRFSGYVLICSCIVRSQGLCPHPDVPTDGQMDFPQKKKFEAGDEVNYSCRKGFALAGKERRICKVNGEWSDHTPFCDQSIPFSNPSISNKDSAPSALSKIMDGNSSTCFEWFNATGQHLYVHLDKKMIVHIVQIFFKKGITKIDILTGRNNDMKLCAEYENFIETDRWIDIKCKSNVLADSMKILVTRNRNLPVCEIQVYGKEEESCESPPSRRVPYGHFEVSRSKATLKCDEGYKSEDSRLVCEGNNSWTGRTLKCEEILCKSFTLPDVRGGRWKVPESTVKISGGTKSQLECAENYRRVGNPYIVCKNNGTWSKANATCEETGSNTVSTRVIIFGCVGLLIVLLVIGLLATTIHVIRKQKNKEVVVLYQSQSDGSVPLSGSEMEYMSTRYEPLMPRKPDPPSTPRPMAKLSTMSNVGAKDWKNTLKSKPVMPPDIMIDTMKPSAIYEN